LAVDLSLAYTARAEAQRVADASALAGASAFIDLKPGESPAVAQPSATRRAKEFAAANYVRTGLDTASVGGVEWTSEDVTVQVIPDSLKVRVWVRQGGIGTFFARLLGVETLSVQASAAAVAAEGGAAQCVWPFSGPDLWLDGNNDDGDGIPEAGETWEWDGEGTDTYSPWDGGTGGTGYGSAARNGIPDDDGNTYHHDYGRPLVIKTTSDGQAKQGPDPGGFGTKLAPGNFLLWSMPDPDKRCNDAGTGAEFLYNNMVGCNECNIPVGETFDAETEPGQKWGKVRDGLDEVIGRDPAMHWDPDLGLNGGFASSTYPAGASPRFVSVALAHPEEHPGVNGRDDITFNNLAVVFLEGYDNKKNVYARFVGYARGHGGPIGGSLIRYLRLVE
jgi:hypothetical protein